MPVKLLPLRVLHLLFLRLKCCSCLCMAAPSPLADLPSEPPQKGLLATLPDSDTLTVLLSASQDMW